MKATCVLSVALLGAGVRLELAGAGVHNLPQLPESAQLAHDHPRVLHHNKYAKSRWELYSLHWCYVWRLHSALPH